MKPRNDKKILEDIFTSKYDSNQIRIIELLQEMHNTSNSIERQVFELKRSALILNAPNDLRDGFLQRGITKRPSKKK